MKKVLNITLIILFAILASNCSHKPIEEITATHDDGSPKIVKYFDEGEKGRILVKEIHYYADGKKKLEGSYKNTQRDGLWTSWYANGNIWSQSEYTDGIENGLYVVYHENGSKYYEGHYKKGNRVGKWTFWDLGGKKSTLNYDKKE